MGASGARLDECLCIHAEENAVIEAGRTKANGGTIYVTFEPCLTCTKTIVQAGIKRVVYINEYPMAAANELREMIKDKIEFVKHNTADLEDLTFDKR